MLCCNAVVEKLKPLIIGKAKNPHCFKAIRGGKQKLPVHYEAKKTAWMTALIFNQWLRKINADFCRKKKNILLMMDNFSGHTVTEQLTNITNVFLSLTLPQSCSLSIKVLFVP